MAGAPISFFLGRASGKTRNCLNEMCVNEGFRFHFQERIRLSEHLLLQMQTEKYPVVLVLSIVGACCQSVKPNVKESDCSYTLAI
jgi:hypothetical protein